MKRVTHLFMSSLLLLACGGAGQPDIAKPPTTPRLCNAESAETYAAIGLKNKTAAKIVTDGTEDLLISQLSETGCFKLVERDRIEILISEMKLCDASNPDKDYFDCSTFAEKGKLLGAHRFILGDVLFAEDDVKGAEIKAKIPGIVDIDLGRSYSGLVVNLRIVDTATAKVLASRDVHALIPTDRGGLGLRTTTGVELKAMAHSSTPMASAYQSMLREGVRRLHEAL